MRIYFARPVAEPGRARGVETIITARISIPTVCGTKVSAPHATHFEDDGPGKMIITALALVVSHTAEMEINPLLGVPGFPDCTNPSLSLGSPVEVAAMELECAQKPHTEGTIQIGLVGDSITAGYHSSGGNHTYPGQLQIMLNEAHPGKYTVTNLGACGATMLKHADSPYWKRPQFTTLNSSKWDIIVIMLGTNDAKDPGDGGPNNWLQECGGPDNTKLAGCTFADDYLSMISLVKTLGTTPAGPKIFIAIPPPLMQQKAYGMNQTVINSVYPKLVPLINAAAKVGTEVIDAFSGMGGIATWAKDFPAKCTDGTPATWPPPFGPCAWYCVPCPKIDQIGSCHPCDQCHMSDNGYTHLATVVKKGLGL